MLLTDLMSLESGSLFNIYEHGSSPTCESCFNLYFHYKYLSICVIESQNVGADAYSSKVSNFFIFVNLKTVVKNEVRSKWITVIFLVTLFLYLSSPGCSFNPSAKGGQMRIPLPLQRPSY